MVCTFFGNRNAPDSIRQILHNTLIDLIENQNADTFYMGNQGQFDYMVRTELEKLKKSYPQLKCYIVLAYIPVKRDKYSCRYNTNTIYPEGLENIPLKFAIDKRNVMMIEWSDIVVTYVRFSNGGANKFKKISERKGKRIIELYNK